MCSIVDQFVGKTGFASSAEKTQRMQVKKFLSIEAQAFEILLSILRPKDFLNQIRMLYFTENIIFMRKDQKFL